MSSNATEFTPRKGTTNTWQHNNIYTTYVIFLVLEKGMDVAFIIYQEKL